ncbi:MAG: lytic transglycosylase domain-containing protein [Burkholderiales bacterium]|jgi:soluble lytic murein transglycosylase-like protein|nr:lytic transglycosylase domain-containing protein [Burkholderiales bacterium]
MQPHSLLPSCAAKHAADHAADPAVGGAADSLLRSPAVPARRRLVIATLGFAALGLPGRARAGAQQYEPMAAAVRNALAAQIADSRPPVREFKDPEARGAFVEWLSAMSGRLKRRKPEDQARVEFLRTLDYECARAGLDRQMVLGLIQVESNFRKYAISHAGARGYMQVMPFWTKVIGDGDPRRLFDLRSNLRYGCVILRHYLDLENGNLFMALGRYNGSRGRPEYPNAVLAAWRTHWSYEASQQTRA